MVRPIKNIDLTYLADISYLLQVAVHYLIAGYRQKRTFFSRLRIVLIFFEYGFGYVKQRYVLDNIRFLEWLANPHVAVVVLDNVFSFQIGDVNKSQSGESGHYKHVSDHIKYTVKVPPIYYMIAVR